MVYRSASEISNIYENTGIHPLLLDTADHDGTREAPLIGSVGLSAVSAWLHPPSLMDLTGHQPITASR